MRLSAGRLAAAGVVIGLLGVGGAGFAYAQSGSPSTTSPSGGGDGQGHSKANCPNMGESGNTTSVPSDM